MSEVTIRKYKSGDLPEMIAVWNEVVEGGVAFPQEETLDSVSGEKFFAAQTYCGVAEVDGKVLGLYILHPNNIGRCGHICINRPLLRGRFSPYSKASPMTHKEVPHGTDRNALAVSAGRYGRGCV